MGETQTVNVNVNTLLVVLGVLASICAVATGVVSFVYHPGGAGLTIRSTVDNINGGFCVMVLSAFVILAGIHMFLLLLRIPLFRNFAAFLVGYVWIGVEFLVLGILCLGVAGLLGFITGIVCFIVGLIFIIIRLVCGPRSVGVTITA